MRHAASAVRHLLGLLLAGALTAGHALEFRSVGRIATLYDAPSQKAKPLYAIASGTPVEVIVTLDAWVKVRDSKGDLAWIERRLLTEQRMLQVRINGASVHAAPSETAERVFEAETDVLLEWLGAGPPGWVKVRHRDGQQGFIKPGQVWGL
jgi:SH3-like domain-containing protein